MKSSDPRLIVALDLPLPRMLALVEQLDPARCALKIGPGPFLGGGPELVERLVRSGYRVFLDLKFHDIPSVVAEACNKAAALGVWMIDVHAAAGPQALAAARAALESHTTRPLLMAVTVLTSMEQPPGARAVERQVLEYACMAAEHGADGVVCSAGEARALRAAQGREFCLVTPGIRPVGHALADDQRRTATPTEAVTAGADYLVVGRPVVRAADPLAALARIEAELHAAQPASGGMA